MVGNDLKAHSVSAPAKVNAGEAYTASVKVVNEGFNAATAFNVELYADGKLVESKPVETLAPGNSTNVEFGLNMHALAEEPVSLHAVVVYSADENADNNTTEAITVSPKVSTLPAVTDLKGEIKAEGAVLSWSEPNLEGGVAETKTDDMESYEGFAHEAEGWTFVDVDGKNVGGFQNTDIPGLTPVKAQQASSYSRQAAPIPSSTRASPPTAAPSIWPPCSPMTTHRSTTGPSLPH